MTDTDLYPETLSLQSQAAVAPPVRSACNVTSFVPVPSDRIGPCMRRVKLALRMGHEHEALQAVRNAFEPTEALTVDSPIGDLDVSESIKGLLDKFGVHCVRDLQTWDVRSLIAVNGLGYAGVKALRVALRVAGLPNLLEGEA